MGIGSQDLFTQLARLDQGGRILRKVGNVQVEGQAALARAFEVAGATHLQVRLSQLEAVVGSAHQVDTLPRFGTQLVARHQDAVGLLGTAAYPAPQLVQL